MHHRAVKVTVCGAPCHYERHHCHVHGVIRNVSLSFNQVRDLARWNTTLRC
jgi:hypothetical protein